MSIKRISADGRVAGMGVLPIMAVCMLLVTAQSRATTTTISSLPYTASQAGTNYSETLLVAGTNLASTTNGINFTGHDIVLNLASDTITFGTAGGDNMYGICFSGVNPAYNIRIIGGWLIHGITNDTLTNGVDCVRFARGAHDVLIRRTNMKVSGDNAHCIDHDPDGRLAYNVEIDGGQYWSYCRRYSSREYYDGAAVRICFRSPSGSYNIKIHGIRIWTGPGQGIVTVGGWGSNPPDCRSQVYSCTVSVDHRNDFYLYNQGPNHPVGASSENAYGIFFSFCGIGSTIHDNVVRSGTSYGGSRGIFMESCQGISSNYITVYNNDVDIHEGPNIRVGEGYGSFAFRMRPIDGQLRYVRVFNNRFIAAGDSVANTRAYGYIPIAFRYSNDIASSFIVFDNNYFKAYAITPGPVESEGLSLDGVFNADTTLVFRNNRYESDHTVVKFGDMQGGAANLRFSGDTLRGLTAPYDFSTYQVGHLGNPWDCTHNMATDIGYEGGASDTNIVFSNGGTLDLTLKRVLIVQVIGRNGLPVRNATVTANNHYNRLVLSGTTNDGGVIRGPVSYWFESRTQNDSTAFNNFTIKARLLQDSTVISFTVSSLSPPATVVLANTDGEPGGEDLVPPAAIHDLGALPGGGQGRINLTWTATGDDDTVGTADHYVIKYSDQLITEDNWAQATTVPDPPPPLGGGLPQEFTVISLPEGQVFFVGIKTYDEADNASPISNVPMSFSSGIASPLPLYTQVNEEEGSATLIAEAVESYLPLYYEFALDEDENFGSPRIEPVLTADTVAMVTFAGLLPDTIYYWRCRAMANGQIDSSAWSSSVSFNIVTGVEMDLSAADCIFPSQGSVVQSRYPTFVISGNVMVPEVYIQVADNALFDSPIQSGALPTINGQNTEWQIDRPLATSATFYWRISSNNILWTSPINFAAEVDIHPYPNPFKESQGHSAITFTNLPGVCNIDIATVSGGIVKRAKGVGPNDWVWDVKNDSGNDVTSGVYLYTVDFHNGSASGKVMIIR